VTKIKELYQDIVELSDYFLELLEKEPATNDSIEGRMVYQCRWLKEQVEKNALTFPVDYAHTLRYASAERLLMHLASSEEDYWAEVGSYLSRFIHACEGQLAYKEEYQTYVVRSIDALVDVLDRSERALDQHESGLMQELYRLKNNLIGKKITPPLGSQLPNYPNYCKVDRYNPTIADLQNGKYLIKLVDKLIFNGIRPDSWLTPEHADRETQY
jgi:hypothetical protein